MRRADFLVHSAGLMRNGRPFQSYFVSLVVVQDTGKMKVAPFVRFSFPTAAKQTTDCTLTEFLVQLAVTHFRGVLMKKEKQVSNR